MIWNIELFVFVANDYNNGVIFNYTLSSDVFSFHLNFIPLQFFIKNTSIDLQYFGRPFFISFRHS